VQEQPDNQTLASIRQELESWARAMGFAQLGITGVELSEHEEYLQAWLRAGYHGSMSYMEKHGTKRSRPAQLIPDTLRIISVRMDYLAQDTQPLTILENSDKAYVSRYTLGRDYHKLVRKRLAALAGKLQDRVGGGQYRAFVDSAPVLERAIAENAGLGWIAKNTMLINSEAGSWFFLGEIYTDLPLPVDEPQQQKHCGTCTSCLDICPTDAFAGPFQLDARRCISYLTIEHHGSIDPQLRPLMGNRVFGCDDCQLCCPWNKFAQHSSEDYFQPRHALADSDLADLFLWDKTTFEAKTEGSAIRRIGYERWLRNLAVALGNAADSSRAVAALKARENDASELVREHTQWALAQHRAN